MCGAYALDNVIHFTNTRTTDTRTTDTTDNRHKDNRHKDNRHCLGALPQKTDKILALLLT